MKKTLKKAISSILLLSLFATTLTAAAAPAAPAQTNENQSIDYESLADAISERYYLDEELKKIGLSIDSIFSLPKQDENFYKEAAELTADILPQSNTRSLPTKTVQTLEAQRLAYAGKMAKWSISKNPSLSEEKEVVYMYLSHYVDVRLPLDASNGISNNSEGNNVFAKYIQDFDRQTYDLYLSKGSAFRAVQRIKNILLWGKDAPKSIIDSTEWLVNQKKTVLNLITNIGSGTITTLDGIDAFDDFAKALKAGKSPEAIINDVIDSFRPKFGVRAETIGRSFSGIIFSTLSGSLEPHAPLISLLNIYIDLLIDIFDRANFAAMRSYFNFRLYDRMDAYYKGY